MGSGGARLLEKLSTTSSGARAGSRTFAGIGRLPVYAVSPAGAFKLRGLEKAVLMTCLGKAYERSLGNRADSRSDGRSFGHPGSPDAVYNGHRGGDHL